MTDPDAILVELRKISAWAETQRKLTKWSFIFLAVFIPIMVAAGIATSYQIQPDSVSGRTADWYDVDMNVRTGNFDKAIRIGEELVLKTPLYPQAHRSLAGAYLAAGKIEKARDQYAETFRLFPSEENEKSLAAIEQRIKTETAKP
jgi:tetratricopeptide (TPR) repeat protein